MKTLIPITFICLTWISTTVGQDLPNNRHFSLPPPDTLDCESIGPPESPLSIGYYAKNNDRSVYTGMQKILWGNHPISYIFLLPKYYGIDRTIPLRDGEGQNQYLLEGNIDLTFPVMQGRNQSSHWAQTNRLSFHYNPALRMTLDSSNPIYPTNQKVGVKWEWVFKNSHTKKSIIQNDPFFYSSKDDWQSTGQGFKMWNLELNIMHYSNGQPPGSNFVDSTNGTGRNDYLYGDFSTNYINAMLIRSSLNLDHLFSLGIGFQLDGGIGETFTYTDDQRAAYGYYRQVGFIQYRSSPKIYGRTWKWLKKKRDFVVWNDFKNNSVYKVKKLIEHRFRFEWEWILDQDLSNYNKTQNYRFSSHLYYQLNFIKARSMGLLLHFFAGRDYFNIRYDDPIYGGGVIGFTFNLRKYTPPRLTQCDLVFPKDYNP